VIIDLPPPKPRAAGATPKPPRPVEEPPEEEERDSKEPAGASLFRRTYVFDEEDLALLGAKPPDAGPPPKPARKSPKE